MTEDDDVLIALTERQEQVLEYIYDCVRDGMPPTSQEIATHCGFRSTNAAVEIVKRLALKKRITLIPNTARGIRVSL
jgi:SOS-response transcriptional repressor LexA